MQCGFARLRRERRGDPVGALLDQGRGEGRLQCAIQRQILLRRLFPTVVRLHAGALQRAPGAWPLHPLQRTLEGVAHRLRRVAVEQETGRARVRQLAVAGVADGIDQSADARGHRDGAVAHRIDRCQAEGLEAAAVQQHIGAGVQQVCAFLAIADRHGDALRIARGQRAVALFQHGIAAAQHGELHMGIGGQRAFDRGQGHVGHLLVRQPAAHRHQRRGRVHRQAHAALQDRLAGALAGGGVGGRVAARQQIVGGRIPAVCVDAVGDGAERVAARLQQAVEAAAELSGQDFARVVGADGGNPVGVADTGLQEVQLAPELDAVGIEALARNAEAGRQFERKQPLERHVVDGQQRGRVQSGGPHQQRRQRRVPVVRVNHLRPRQRRAAGRDGGGRVRQRGETLRVVGKVAPGRVGVRGAGPVEQRRAIQQHDLHLAARHAAGQQPHRTMAGRQGQPGRLLRQSQCAKAAQPDSTGQGLRIARHQDRDLNPLLLQGTGEAADDVAQTSGLGQRHGLSRHE
ncbi:hypothetical protein L602_001200000440 [Cupriavidus gilardii J11]|uniref:Uncharacterized protein n=1 Tax=Cupriavidus gilardii J11 TaxID=936133 RepID=A0A562BT81_9BURK|nr:hypothetical protein L602_001200000440 [Cupriavidus gilardii J11]